jgi:YHS domain-containing protein
VQDPQIQLNELGITLDDPVDPSRKAVIDAAHRSFVNWEAYFFADLDTKRRFDDDPLRWCGVVTDPVSRQRFAPGTNSPRASYDGRVYFFYTADDKTKFESMPALYATANADMVPM